MDIGVIAINILVAVLLFLGVILTMISLPGNWFILVVAALYGFSTGFVHLSIPYLLMLLALVLLGEAVEFAAGALGAKRQQASKQAMLAAVVGGVAGGLAGTAVLPVIGSIGGALAGAFGFSYFAEYAATGSREQSRRVASSVLVGQIIGMVVKLAIAIGVTVAVVSKLF